MNRTTPIRFLFGILAALGAYGWYAYQETRNPEKIFTTAWGAMNSVSYGSDFVEYFERLRRMQKDGQMYLYKDKAFVTTNSIVEYFTSDNNSANSTPQTIKWYERRIQALKKLNPGRDAKPLVAAAIDLYQFMDGIHKNDFLRVAEMIDSGVPDDQVNAHLEELMLANEEEISERYSRLFELITAYGDKHGIKYSVNE